MEKTLIKNNVKKDISLILCVIYFSYLIFKIFIQKEIVRTDNSILKIMYFFRIDKLLFCVPIFYYFIKTNRENKYFKVNKKLNITDFITYFALIFYINIFLNLIISFVINIEGQKFIVQRPIYTDIISAICIAPVLEEIVFRGVLMTYLKKYGIDGLVVIGGDGSFHGAHYLYEEHGIKTIGIPGTIDNDVAGTDYTIGYDTALNIILDAISKLKDTATSHERTYLVEVMGRNCGDLALYSAIAGGASGVMIPENESSIDDLAEVIKKRRAEGKLYDIIVVAEGVGNVVHLKEELSKRVDTSIRVTILGHIQRGGAPTAADRILATRLAVKAVELSEEGKGGLMVGIQSEEVTTHKLSYAWENYSKASAADYVIANMLSL